MEIQYGVEINIGNPTLNDFSIGLVAGVFKWSTGRAVDIGEFKNAIIVKDSFSEVSQEIGIIASGSYSTMSGFNLKIDNAENIVDAIRDLDINLIQADTIFYTFRRETSEDEWGQTQDWTGKVLDSSYDENEFSIQFMDSFRGIHKPLLKKVFTLNEFPDCPDSILGKAIPLSIGRVSKNKLFPVVQRSQLEVICTSSAVDYEIAPATAYTDGGAAQTLYKILTLKTVDKIFAANALQGKFLSAVKVGNEAIRITGNAASAAGVTNIYLEKPFSTALIAANLWSATGADVWYFQISSLVVNFLVSQKEIFEFGENDQGQKSLFKFDSDLKEFEDISDLIGINSLTDIEGIGYPGIAAFSNPVNLDGDTFYYSFGVPESLVELTEVLTNTGAVTGTRPTPNAGTELTNLKDRDNSTSYTWITTGGSAGVSVLKIPFKIKVPAAFLTDNVQNIYFAFNHEAFFRVGSFLDGANLSIAVYVKLVDFLGRTTIALDAERFIFDTDIGLPSKQYHEKNNSSFGFCICRSNGNPLFRAIQF